MKAIGNLDLPVSVVGIAPCTENMPDAAAYRPADVITASNNTTIEIINTDAEGRMILADALVYAEKYNPAAVIDLATLTGACIVALGKGISAGLFCNDEDLQSKLIQSGIKTHERVWPMPLWDDYRLAIESEVADIRNTGGRDGGVGTSAIFLREFTDFPWAHLDIAGMALRTKADINYKYSKYIPLGGTGFGVRLLTNLLQHWENVS
jgi:leucyl aminopeptidase